MVTRLVRLRFAAVRRGFDNNDYVLLLSLGWFRKIRGRISREEVARVTKNNVPPGFLCSRAIAVTTDSAAQ